MFDNLIRTRNYIWHLYNLFLMSLCGIHYGERVVIHGHLGLRNRGTLIIGDSCYISSGSNINPLCSKDNGFISVEKGALLTIGNKCAMSSPRIWAHQEITIGDYVMLGANVTIVDSDCHSMNHECRRKIAIDQHNKKNKAVHIEDDVFIGMNTMILKGVTIGARSVIGAGSVVTKSIPADCIAAGNPAIVIKQQK